MALRFLEFHVLGLVLPRQLPGDESRRQKNEECKTRNVGPILGDDAGGKPGHAADGSRGDPKYGLSPKPSRAEWMDSRFLEFHVLALVFPRQ